MRKSLPSFFISLAVFLAFLVGFSEALKHPPLARLIFFRLLLIVAGLFIWGRWALRILSTSPLVPVLARAWIQNTLRAISQGASHLIFSPRIGLAFACVVFAFSTFFSVWYASLGQFPQFPNINNLYIDQANAFRKGQLSLIETPSPQILALSDPYTFENRRGLSYLWDVSLFRDKYYLYWGPAPAAALAIIMTLTGGPVPDSLLVVLSIIGISAIVLVLLWEIRKRFYPQSPAIFIGLFLLMTTINLPYLFILGRGRAYETSIITGQFFLLLGLAAFFAFCWSKKSGWLFLAGFSWGLSIACRYNLAISVAVFLAFGLWIIWSSTCENRTIFKRASYLIVPFAVCIIGLGLFNWMRFGNPLETGLSYQLTTPVSHNQHFSIAYLRTNIYLNVLYSYRKVELFPLIRSIAVVPGNAPAWVHFHTGKQNDETIFGLRLIPFFWLFALLLPLSGGFWWRVRWKRIRSTFPVNLALPKICWMIGLAGLLQFVMLLFYYYSAVRFMADFFLLWMLTVIFLLWSLDRQLIHLPWVRTMMWFTAALAIILTVFLGFLAGFDNPPQVFHIYNPALEDKIALLWNAIYTSPGIIGKILRYLLNFVL